MLDGKDADYVFNFPCAWDDIHLTSPLPLDVDVFYWGTLALRSEVSRQTFRKIAHSINARIKYFDVNIRKKFYSEDIIKEDIELCNILKVNEKELPLILSLTQMDNVNELRKEYSLEIVILTEGEKGSTIYGERTIKIHATRTNVVDTVGAGDSYSACFFP